MSTLNGGQVGRKEESNLLGAGWRAGRGALAEPEEVGRTVHSGPEGRSETQGRAVGRAGKEKEGEGEGACVQPYYPPPTPRSRGARIRKRNDDKKVRCRNTSWARAKPACFGVPPTVQTAAGRVCKRGDWRPGGKRRVAREEGAETRPRLCKEVPPTLLNWRGRLFLLGVPGAKEVLRPGPRCSAALN